MLPSGDHWTPATACCVRHSHLLVDLNVSYNDLKRTHTRLYLGHHTFMVGFECPGYSPNFRPLRNPFLLAQQSDF